MIRPSAFSAWVYEQANTAAASLIYFAKQGTQLIFGPLAKREALLPVFRTTMPWYWVSPFAAPSS